MLDVNWFYYYFSITLFRIRNAVCCDKPMECANSVHCAARTALLYVKAGGGCNYHYTLEVNEVIPGNCSLRINKRDLKFQC